MADERFKDNGESVYDFLDKVLVICPECKRCAYGFLSWDNLARITCHKCGFNRAYRPYSFGGGSFCDADLWLKTNCCSEKLWAYNQVHLEFIEKYVGAKLRERTLNFNQNLASRLPEWMIKSSNRSKVLKGVQILKKKLEFT